MGIGAVVASTCCCTPTNCDCTAYAQLTVSWSGTLTLAGDCPVGCDTSSDHSATVTYSGIEVTVVREDGEGNCSYTGTLTREDAYDLCDLSGSGVVSTQFYATVYYNALMTRWEVALYVRTGFDGVYAAAGGSCGWYTGGAGNAVAVLAAYEPSGNADHPACPELATYTTIGGSSCSTTPECTGGADCCGGAERLQVSAYTAGTLAVS